MMDPRSRVWWMQIDGRVCQKCADVMKARESNEKRFVDGATEAKLEDTDWVWEDELELLREEIGSVSDQCRADETKKMVNTIEVRATPIKRLWPLN